MTFFVLHSSLSKLSFQSLRVENENFEEEENVIEHLFGRSAQSLNSRLASSFLDQDCVSRQNGLSK